MKRLLYLVLFLFIAYSIYLGAYSVLHGELNFFNDVARDFLLLQELDQKKIVLIGPRTNTSGLFHGPLWTYINYPAYILGNGNPVIVAWFWIFFEIVVLFTSYLMVKKMLSTLPAFAFVLLFPIRLVGHVNGIFHSEATIFFVPFFLFTITMYIERKKFLYLALHMISSAMLIQLNVGVGIPFLILSLFILSWFIFKNRLWKHLLALLLIPLCLSNFILFDILHRFQMSRAILAMSRDHTLFSTLSSLIQNRIENTISLQLFTDSVSHHLIAYFTFGLIIIFTIVQIKNKSKHTTLYFLLPFYYFGYMLLSFYSRGVLLYHLIYLLIPLTIIWLVSFLEGRYKIIFAILVIIVYILNLQSATSYNSYLQSGFIRKNPYSWLGLSNVAQQAIAQQKGKEFGYFVFSPDAYAYQPRYAMIYNFKNNKAKSFEYVKKPTTYIIAAPAPADDPYMTYVWWRKVPVGITKDPVKLQKFPNGYTIEMYNLTPQEQKIPFDPNIELGIHFR